MDGSKLIERAPCQRARALAGTWAATATLVLLPAISGTAMAVSPAERTKQPAPTEQVLYTADSYPVHVQVWPPYEPQSAAETVIGVLNELLHNTEMGLLHVSVRTPADVKTTCGSDAVACYYGDHIVLPGEQSGGQPPVSYLLAHEYAHHILGHRRNDPWPADLWGPKRWASELDVCTEVRRHELFLGYTSIPAEAYAETFAMMHFPELHLPWSFTDLLAPDEAAEAAVRADVLRPWTRPRTRSYRGRLRAGGSRTVRLATPLDGTARFSLTGRPRMALALVARRRVLVHARPRRPATKLSFTICGQRRLSLRLTAVKGHGRYVLTTLRP